MRIGHHVTQALKEGTATRKLQAVHQCLLQQVPSVNGDCEHQHFRVPSVFFTRSPLKLDKALLFRRDIRYFNQLFFSNAFNVPCTCTLVHKCGGGGGC